MDRIFRDISVDRGPKLNKRRIVSAKIEISTGIDRGGIGSKIVYGGTGMGMGTRISVGMS